MSALAYVHRLYTLGRLTDWLYRSLNIQIKANYGVTEPGPPRPREASQVLSKVLLAADPGTSRKDIIKYLRIPITT